MNKTSRIGLAAVIGLLVVVVGLLAAASGWLGAEEPSAAPASPSPAPEISDPAAPAPDAAAVETHDQSIAAQLAAMRDPDVPELPFPDNPDPSQCGIPTEWTGDNDRAWLNGYYQGELVQPTVFLYNSHNRLSITAEAPHGAEVEVVLAQYNPVVNYYMVRIVGLEGVNEGWIPEPFLSFEPLDEPA